MCPDPELPNALHSEYTNTLNIEFLSVPLCSAPMSYLAANGVVPCATGTSQRVGACSIALDGDVASILALWR